MIFCPKSQPFFDSPFPFDCDVLLDKAMQTHDMKKNNSIWSETAVGQINLNRRNQILLCKGANFV